MNEKDSHLKNPSDSITLFVNFQIALIITHLNSYNKDDMTL